MPGRFDPAGAAPRTDLPFLRHRTNRTPPAPSGAGTGAAVADFLHGTGGRPPHRDHPPAVAPAPPAPSSSSLDLSTGSTGPGAPVAPLATGGLAPGATSGARTTASATDPAGRARPRVGSGQRRVLSVADPTVGLSRVQSGVGRLRVEAVCSADVGDLRLGALYQLRDGASSTVQLAGGRRFAPFHRPMLAAGRDTYEHLTLDLRWVREVQRLAVYAFSESRGRLAWGGTLVATTVGGGRIELPLDTLHPGPLAVLASVYNVDGELVVRAEMETIDGDVREAARAYGYDRITWRDARSPAD